MKQEMNEYMRKEAALIALSTNYDQIMPKELSKVWLDLLANYSAKQVEQGVNKIICEYEYKTRPPFAVLKKAIDGNTAKKQIDTEKLRRMEAEDEWDFLLEDIEHFGSYEKPELNPVTERVLHSMGGWEASCLWETSKLEWRRKDFIERFLLISEQEDYLESNLFKIPDKTNGPRSVASILGMTKKLDEKNG